uniref:Uncharacterized protein n=1 Tax=Anguilla anguilla TaxID=7936 RepID=A0A0E9QQV2_ANGAN
MNKGHFKKCSGHFGYFQGAVHGRHIMVSD